ncbi:DUF6884 domain-containing protein [Enterobacter hormaechei]|uniref:DUF6884 domain-containing protein n=1 Tax=Cronobacter sakazakii TaxID=28141 RepID=UPI001AE32A1D|nr:DUF6884 domain-containing protein [Cronobacter sakazakii]
MTLLKPITHAQIMTLRRIDSGVRYSLRGDGKKVIERRGQALDHHDHINASSLIIMACSATKGREAAPAMDLYKGVMYSTFRANVPTTHPAIVILSAKHGFIEADRFIEPYEQCMTEARADEMIAKLPDLDSIRWPTGVHSILLAGGKTYQRVMRAAIKRRIELGLLDNGIIIEQTSGGIGYQRAQLGAYLRSLPNSNVNHDKVTVDTTMHIKRRAMSTQLDATAEQDIAAEGQE